MTAFWIKILAILFMVSSHLGYFLLPQYPGLIILGSISFPLFSWLIANGAHHTRDIRAYLKRLALFALISQGPFILVNHYILHTSWFYLNIFFTLFLGLLAIYAIKRPLSPIMATIAVWVCALTAQLFHTDYGALGVLSIVLFYLFFSRKRDMVLAQLVVLYAIPISIVAIYQSVNAIPVFSSFDGLVFGNSLHLLGLIIALCIIALYNDKEGRKLTYAFYLFYPIHFLVIYFLWLLMY